MTDIEEWDQESYGRGYMVAEEDIKRAGIAYAESFAANLQKSEKNQSLVAGYVTCVNAWKEGVRL